LEAKVGSWLGYQACQNHGFELFSGNGEKRRKNKEKLRKNLGSLKSRDFLKKRCWNMKKYRVSEFSGPGVEVPL